MKHMVKGLALSALSVIGFALAGFGEATYTPLSYVAQTNLVACWDGICNDVDENGELCHNPEATGWRDVVNGLTFVFSGSPTVGENCIGFNGDASNYGRIPSTAEGFSTAFFSGEKAVEVVARGNTTANNIAFMGSAASKVTFGPYNGNRIVLNQTSDVMFPQAISTQTPKTYSTYYNSNNRVAAVNCEGQALARSSDSQSWDNSDANAWIGRRSAGSYPYNGELYAIRIYDRQLTADEVSVNAAIDAIRFRGEEPDEAFARVGVRPGEDGGFEYYVSVDAAGLGTVSIDGGETAGEQVSGFFPAGATVTVTLTPQETEDVFYGLLGVEAYEADETGLAFAFTVGGSRIDATVGKWAVFHVASDSAMTTIRAAYEAAKAALDNKEIVAAEILVGKGTYAETDFLLDKPIVVRGATGDPADVIIDDAVTGKRAFRLTDPGAGLEALTIRGTGLNQAEGKNGGHLVLESGTVANCVITGGTLGRVTNGGNVYMTGGLIVDSTITKGNINDDTGMGGNVYMGGGRLLRCKITEGVTAGGSATAGYAGFGGGVYATGGTIESCLVADNASCPARNYGSTGGIYIKGGVTVVNCTVVNNTAKTLSLGVGIEVAADAASVINTVLLNNGGTVTTEYGSAARLGRYVCCASSVVNPDDPACVTVTRADFAGYDSGDYTPVSSSALVDGGTDDGVPASVLAADALDLYLKPRLSGAALDIGCVELDQSMVAELVGVGAYVGKPAVFRADSDEPGALYRWSFGDDTVETTQEKEIVHVYGQVGFYQVEVSVSTDGGQNWGAPKTLAKPVQVVPECVYVDPDSPDPAAPYGEPGHAARNLKEALAVLTSPWSADEPCFGTVVIVAGKTLAGEDNLGIVLRYPVTIRGETGNPADAVIDDAVTGKRAFRLEHPSARLESLTISGTGVNSSAESSGAHLYLIDGVVSNCVITGGSFPQAGCRGGNVFMESGLVVDSTITHGHLNEDSGRGGNVYLAGGRLLRCKVTDGVNVGGTSALAYVCYGGGIFATGESVVENCLVANNSAASRNYGRAGGVYLEGAAKAVSCTVVGNTAKTFDCGAGIAVANAGAKVVNTVIYDNGDTLEKNVGTSNTNRYDFSATVGEGLNETCKTIDETAFGNYAEWQTTGDIQFLAPAKGGLLQNGGSKAKDYSATGATSTTDLRGRNRLSGRFVDIGALETPNTCSYMLLR